LVTVDLDRHLARPGAGNPPDVVVDVLVQALAYIERFRGSTAVVKVGGGLLADPTLLAGLAQDITLLHRVGVRPVVVHGGGPQIDDWLARLGVEPVFVNGRRVTDEATLDVVSMVLLGQVNAGLVTALNGSGPSALGLSGTDARMLEVTVADPALGLVGAVTQVHPELIERALAADLIPVVATLSVDTSGQVHNVNADDAAVAIAVELAAAKLLFLTDVPGLLADADDPASLVTVATTSDIDRLVAAGKVSGGMVPKLVGCVRAVEAGVQAVHLLDGRRPHVLLHELFTDAGSGTMVVHTGPPAPRLST
jgi:acetylglutamate kinase